MRRHQRHATRARLLVLGVAAVLSLHGCDSRGIGTPDAVAPDLTPATIRLESRNPERLRLALIGDMHGNLPIGAGLAARHRAEPVDAVLILGDNFGNCGVTGSGDPAWRLVEKMQPLDVRLFPVLGNHDYGNPMERRGKLRFCGDPDPGSQVRSGDAAGWTFPSRNYIIESDLATLLMLDTTPLQESFEFSFRGSGTAGDVLAVAKRSLADLARRDAPWTFVAGHHQILTSSTRRSGEERKPSEPMTRLYRMLQSAGVDLYLSGHQHHLELLTAGRSAPAFVMSGAASRPKQFFEFAKSTGAPHFPPDPSFEQLGFAVLEITRDAIEVTFYDQVGAPLAAPFTVRRGDDGSIVVQRSGGRAGSA